MRTFLSLMIVISLSAFAALADDGRKTDKPGKATTAITTAEQAVDRALEITGFERAQYQQRPKASEMATKVIVTDAEDKTPFFHDRIVGNELWRVTFDSVYVHIPTLQRSWERNQIPKTYDVYIDPETGYLLKMESRWSGRDTTLSDEPPHDFAAADMMSNGLGYLDIVKVMPETDFYEAVQTADMCYAANAKQIVAHLVMNDYGGVDARPVWSILGRGTPPFDAFGPGGAQVPVWQLNRNLCLVDAMKGSSWLSLQVFRKSAHRMASRQTLRNWVTNAH